MIRHFSFAGMQRCGNYAIIAWWHKHFNGYRFRNNILGVSCKAKAAQYKFDGLYSEQIRIDSWENFPPRQIQISNNSEPLIVVLRDPYNWWASWFKYIYLNPNIHSTSTDDVINAYLSYVDYATTFPNVSIIFNAWFQSADYRRQLETFWKLNESDIGLNEVSKLGCGSSFDKYAFQGCAQKMRVLNRYETVMYFPAYREPLREHPELADISRELFDFEPPEGIH